MKREFKLGDRVRRIEGENFGFKAGDTGTVIGLVYPFVDVRMDRNLEISMLNHKHYLELIHPKIKDKRWYL